LQLTVVLIPLHSKRHTWISCTIKRKSLLLNYGTRHTENDIT